MNLDAKIEAILFYKGEAVSRDFLSKTLGVSSEEIEAAISALSEKLENRGLVLVVKDDEVALTTAPEASSLIEKLTKEELSRDIGKAGMETLSIILYKNPVSRREIDYIRGVNSTFILRNLLIRGLVEREQDKKDQRQFLYTPTFELMNFLGIKKLEDLPQYQKVIDELNNLNIEESLAEGQESQ